MTDDKTDRLTEERTGPRSEEGTDLRSAEGTGPRSGKGTEPRSAEDTDPRSGVGADPRLEERTDSRSEHRSDSGSEYRPDPGSDERASADPEESADSGPQERVDVIGLESEALEEALTEHFAARNQPSYRADQVVHWLHDELAASFDAVTTLPKDERAALADAFRLTEHEPHTVARSEDDTVKHLWKLEDGELVESVLIPSADRLTLCISSQAGCALGCTFCATGWSGFARQLTTGEIVAQYRGAQRWAREHDYGRISNVVYMGMGEPMANRKAVFPSLTILNRAYGIGARHITVSTVGLVPGIVELADRPEQFTLAVSLHAPNHELRQELIPLEKRYPLPELMEALRTYTLRSSRRLTFEYTMIDGVNDTPELARELVGLAEELGAFVNLIPFNPIPYRDWAPSPPERIRAFADVLRQREIPVEVRRPRGRDIDAACGQLRAKAEKGEEAQSGQAGGATEEATAPKGG